MPETHDAVDFSFARYTAEQLNRAGIHHVGRYIALDAERDQRDMSGTEFRHLVDGGITVWLIAERGKGDGAVVRGNYNDGYALGQYYKLCAGEYPWPKDRPIYLATDVDVAGWQIDGALEHYRGFRDGVAPHPAGAYAGKLLLKALRDRLGFRYLWSSNARYWDHGITSLDGLLIQQHLDGPLAQTDLNTTYGPDWGQFPLNGNPPLPAGDDTMDPKDIEAVAQRTAALLAPAVSTVILGEIKLAQALPLHRAIKQDGDDPTQYYLDNRVIDGVEQVARVKLPDDGQATLELYREAGWIDNLEEPLILNGDGNDPVTKAFNALPVVDK